jgi:hypothetical protein
MSVSQKLVSWKGSAEDAKASQKPKQLVKIRVNSWIFNTQYAIPNTSDEIASTLVENSLQIDLFVQNKPKVKYAQINVSSFITSKYVKVDIW